MEVGEEERQTGPNADESVCLAPKLSALVPNNALSFFSHRACVAPQPSMLQVAHMVLANSGCPVTSNSLPPSLSLYPSKTCVGSFASGHPRHRTPQYSEFRAVHGS